MPSPANSNGGGGIVPGFLKPGLACDWKSQPSDDWFEIGNQLREQSATAVTPDVYAGTEHLAGSYM